MFKLVQVPFGADFILDWFEIEILFSICIWNILNLLFSLIIIKILQSYEHFHIIIW